ncbi:unnamed protein product [Phaedon cochleariae]|uniref:Uncharacterized protein n=1 Tax=Phaedon cochleariae TaxID=80249 RepID=A0A9P0DTJ4_PHACE|nr:unnamed protein product [Phaedon cochleariae]
MSEKPDTVPGLGFKDKDKALETIKILEGRDPDYQKLAIKGLVGRAKRTLTLTKDKDKLANINEAVATFDEWLRKFELNNLSKENRPYLPIACIDALLPLRNRYDIESKQIDSFLNAYRNQAKGEYKNLRTISSGNDEPTWDIIRNAELKKLLKEVSENDSEMWEEDLPSKKHMEIILWAYSPDASKIKKNISTYEEKLGKTKSTESKEMDVDERNEEKCGKRKSNEEKKPRERKRKSSNDSSSQDEESPKKKSKDTC